jgi:hypothetical protein
VPATSIAIRVPGLCRARVVVLAAALACGAGAGATAAAARPAPSRVVTVCSAQVTLYETPGGAKVGILHRGDRVRVVAGTAAREPWWRVVAGFGTRGWLRASAICERDR